MAPLMSDTHGGGRFDAVMPVPLHRMWLAKRRFNQAELMAKGVVGRIEGLVLDKLKVVSRTRNRIELSAVKRWALTRHEGLWREKSPRRRRFHQRRHRGRVFWGIRKAGAGEVHPCAGRGSERQRRARPRRREHGLQVRRERGVELYAIDLAL